MVGNNLPDNNNGSAGRSDKPPSLGRNTINRYIKRGVIIGLGLIVFFALVSLFWKGDKQENNDQTLAVTSLEETLENTLQSDAPPEKEKKNKEDSENQGLLQYIFGNDTEILEDSPHNLNNVEHLDDFNLDTDDLVKGTPSNGSRNFQKIEKEYQYQIPDILNADVRDNEGNYAGQINDIVIHRKTGKAKAILITQDNDVRNMELTAIDFNQITNQNQDGDVKTQISEEQIEKKKKLLAGSALNSKEYISLRGLENSRILDDQGNIAGAMNTVIYQNAEIQHLFFSVIVEGKEYDFGLPYDGVDIIERNGRHDIQLTKEQTKFLAEKIYN